MSVAAFIGPAPVPPSLPDLLGEQCGLKAVSLCREGQSTGRFKLLPCLSLSLGVAALSAIRRPRRQTRSASSRPSLEKIHLRSTPQDDSAPSQEWKSFAEWATARGANLASVTESYASGMRGLVATRDIEEGESIVEVPIGASVELADANSQKDPSAAALALLRADVIGEDVSGDLRPYLATFPRADSLDIMTMPDFFTDAELAMLQCPLVAEKTQKRQALCRKRAAENGFSETDLKWALCTVAQRSTTWLSPVDGFLRLLLPGVDFFNHEIDSPHAMKVRWQMEGHFNGVFKLVAGAPIKAGEEIYLSYGGNPWRAEGCGGDCAGDVAWNNLAYLQRYGFVETSLGTTMVDGKWLVSEEAASTRKALEATSIEEDEAMLSDESWSPAARVAISFRLHLKRALSAQLASEAAEEAIQSPTTPAVAAPAAA